MPENVVRVGVDLLDEREQAFPQVFVNVDEWNRQMMTQKDKIQA